jgi:hypothetical protein
MRTSCLAEAILSWSGSPSYEMAVEEVDAGDAVPVVQQTEQ